MRCLAGGGYRCDAAIRCRRVDLSLARGRGRYGQRGRVARYRARAIRNLHSVPITVERRCRRCSGIATRVRSACCTRPRCAATRTELPLVRQRGRSRGCHSERRSRPRGNADR